MLHLVGKGIDPATGKRRVPPWEMVELQLCRIYRCRPSELGQEDWYKIRRHMTIIEAETDLAALNNTPS